MAFCLMQIFQRIEELAPKDVTRTFIEGGGGGVYSYIHVLPNRFLVKLRNWNLI